MTSAGRGWPTAHRRPRLPSETDLESLDTRLSQAFRLWLVCAMCGVAATALALAVNADGISKWLAVVTAAAFVMVALNIGHARVLDLLFADATKRGSALVWRLARPSAFEPVVVAAAALLVGLFTDVF